MSTSRAFGLLLATALACSGCGFRTPPRPAEETAPLIEGKVQAVVEDGAVVVRWPRAEHSADGKQLYDLSAFVVERSLAGGPFEAVATIDVVDQDRIRRRGRFAYRDESAQAAAAVYRVRAVCADGEEGPPTPLGGVRPTPAAASAGAGQPHAAQIGDAASSAGAASADDAAAAPSHDEAHGQP